MQRTIATLPHLKKTRHPAPIRSGIEALSLSGPDKPFLRHLAVALKFPENVLSSDEKKALEFFAEKIRSSEEKALIRFALDGMANKTLNGLRLPKGVEKETLSVQIEAYRAAWMACAGQTFISSTYRAGAGYHGLHKAVDISGAGKWDMAHLYGLWNYLIYARPGNFGFGIGYPPAAMHVHLDMGRPARFVSIEISKPDASGHVDTISPSSKDWQNWKKKVNALYVDAEVAKTITSITTEKAAYKFTLGGTLVGAAIGHAKGSVVGGRLLPSLLYAGAGMATGYAVDRISEFDLHGFLERVRKSITPFSKDEKDPSFWDRWKEAIQDASPFS